MLNWLHGFIGMSEETKQMHTDQQIEWLRSSKISNPHLLRAELFKTTTDEEAGEAQFRRALGDSAAFLGVASLAEEQKQRRARKAALPGLISDAERLQRAFLTLGALFVGPLAESVRAKLDILLHDPPSEQAELNRALAELLEASRLRARTSAVLRTFSTHPDFREPDDALQILRDEWEFRIERLDRVRLPGSRPRFEAPPQIAALFEVLAGRKEVA